MTRGQLPKAYLRLDPDIDQKHPDNLEAFIRLLCAANRQVPRGRFASRFILERVIGKAAVGKLADRHDIVTEPDGSITVPGWAVWQEGDYTVAERMRRYRASKDGTVTPTVTTPVTPTVTSPSPTSEATRRQGVKAVDVLSDVPSKGHQSLRSGARANGGMTHVGDVVSTLKPGPTAETARLTKAQFEAWKDFGSEWDAFKAAWFGKGLLWPPQGTPHDDDEVNPSPRAMLYGILDARPTDLPRWVTEAPGRTQRDVITYVLDQWHAVRDAVPTP